MRDEQPLAEGGDGKIFRLHQAVSDGSGPARMKTAAGVPLLGKFYHTPTPERRRKLAAMLDERPDRCVLRDASATHGVRVQIAWPTHILTASGGEVLGFAMPEVDLRQTVVLETLLSRRSRSEHGLSHSYKKRFAVAHNIAILVSALHEKGHHLIDLKPLNIQVYRTTFYVALLDTDGFSICGPSGTRFPGHQYTPGYIAPEAGRQNRPPEALGEAQDRFALAVILFQLLNRGLHPFQGVPAPGATVPPTNQDRINAALYAYGQTPHPKQAPSPFSLHPWFDDNTQRLFDRAFAVDPASRPSAKTWREHLSNYVGASPRRLAPCPDHPDHARFLGEACGLCEIENEANRAAPPEEGQPHRTAPSTRPRTTARPQGTPTSPSGGAHPVARKRVRPSPSALARPPATPAPWSTAVENGVPALVKVLTASVVLSLLTISIASGGSDSLEAYALGVHFYSLFTAAVVGRKRALAHSFREAWIILTGTFGLAGAWMINLVDLFPVVVSGLLSVGFAAALAAHQLWSFTQRTRESLSTYADRYVLRVFVSHVVLSLAIFLVALSFDLGIADPGPSARPVKNAAAERVDSSRAEAEDASPRSPIAFDPERFTMTYISPVDARLYVRVEDDEWTDYGVRFQKIRDGDTTRVQKQEDGPANGPARAMPLDFWQRGDTARVVVESLPRTAPRSGETQLRVVQDVYDDDVMAVAERFDGIRARRSSVVDTLRRTAVIEDGFSPRLTVRFLEAADGSTYVDVVPDASVDLDDARVFVRRDGRTYSTVPTADHGALARILDIETGDEIRISVRRVGPSAPDGGEDVTLTTSYPGPPRSAAISTSDVDGKRDTRPLFIE